MALPYLNLIRTDLQSAFERGVRAMSGRLGIVPDQVMIVMYRESQLSPTAVNPKSRATGLIQFMPDTAAGLGTSVYAIEQMNAVQQLPYVERYLASAMKMTGVRPQKLVDLYLLVLYPKASGKPGSYVVFRQGTIAYTQNASINPNGNVTVADVERFVSRSIPSGWTAAATSSAGLAVGGLLIGGIAAWFMYQSFQPKTKQFS